MELPQEILDVRACLAQGPAHVHCLGICGIGMAGVAAQLKAAGWQVSGCDLHAQGRLADWLRARGIAVYAGHATDHLDGVRWLVHSAAISDDNLEIAAARRLGLPVFRRGYVLAAWLAERDSVIVCGSHGKTTTTAMLIQILQVCGLAPDYCIGGECPALDGVAGVGAGKVFVAEADESDGTLAAYSPAVAVLTNVEFDHAEHFRDLDAILACFAEALRRTRRCVVYCADDALAVKLGKSAAFAINYGLSLDADVRGVCLEETAHGACFELFFRGERKAVCRLPVPGRHNILNALGACAAAHAFGVGWDVSARALEHFVPVHRRFECVAEKNGMRVFSDYAHHPTEIAATLANFRRLPAGRRIIVFQPHRYSRTRALARDFPAAFAGAEELILAPVYAASETPVEGGSIWDLYAAFRARPVDFPRISVAELPQVCEYLRRQLAPTVDVLVMGAGDVVQVAEQLRAMLAGKSEALNPVSEWISQISRLPLSAGTTWRAAQPLAEYTTLRVGGAADLYVEAAGREDLQVLLVWAARKNVPITVLGAGSNLVVGDLGVRGVVLRLVGESFCGIRRMDGAHVVVGGGTRLADLMRWCAENEFAGLEFLYGIPGTLGGALRMNAGAWGGSVGEHVVRAEGLDRRGNFRVFDRAEMVFGYRDCPTLADYVICAAVLEGEPCAVGDVRRRQAAVAARRRQMQWGRSAGSVFRNPPGDFAGRLLEEAGCKTLAVGGARVAATHANVIVTHDGANASDVRALAELMRRRVRVRFGIELTKEIVYCD